jgi:hypothetical protein
VLKTEDFECAFFLGSPGKNQKTTILFSRGKRLLGYCKVTDRKDVFELFDKEARLLRFLKEHGMTHVPECLFCGEFQGNFFFFQTTERVISSDFHHRWKLAWNFVKALQEGTQRTLRFEDSSYYRMLGELREDVKVLPPEHADFVLRMMEEVCRTMKGTEGAYSVYHGDLTPWNSFRVGQDLFVFDFEYAQYDYPPYLDLFHYVTQTGSVEHRGVDWIMDRYRTWIVPKLKDSGWDAALLYKMYLLDIIQQYIQNDRIGGEFSPLLMGKIAFWCNIGKQIEV